MVAISVIVPTYKTAQYLPKCLDSILNQTFQDFEIIIVSDGPEEDHRLADEYALKDSRITVLKNVKRDLGGARNAGIKISKGKYICSIDSDDWIEPTYLERMHNAITLYDDIDIVLCGVQTVFEDKEDKYLLNHDENYFAVKQSGIIDCDDIIFGTINVATWNKLYKKEIIEKYNLKFPENLRNEDALFTWEYWFVSRKMYCIQEKLYNYLRRDSSLMALSFKKGLGNKVLDHLKVGEKLYKFLCDNNLYETRKCGFWRAYVICWCFVRDFGSENNVKKAIKIINKFFKNTELPKPEPELMNLIDIKTNLSKKIKFKYFIQNLFSMQNIDNHKVITILGIRMKFKSQKLINKRLRREIENLNAPRNFEILQNAGELFGFSRTNKINILKKNLTQVEIEIFSYCNRQCWFCPNSFIDRHSENHFLDEELYLSVLKQLKEMDYSNVITYSRYNEPLSNKEVFIKRLKQAKEYCPNAVLRTNSNGDFLTDIGYLDELAQAGLQDIDVQCYLNKEEKYSSETFDIKTKKFAHRLGLNYRVENCGSMMRAYFDYDKMKLTYTMFDFENVANNRGESLENVKEYSRQEACLVPFQHLYIDYTGDVMLCCNLRHDIESHQNFIIGNINNQSLADIFMSEKMLKFRRLLCCCNTQIDPCKTCRFYVEQSRMDLRRC